METTFLSRNDDGETLPAAHGRRAGLLSAVPVDLPVGPAGEDFLERNAAFQSRQCRTEAEVDAVAEAQVPVDAAVDVEPVGVREVMR
jgi:hypothetical protein